MADYSGSPVASNESIQATIASFEATEALEACNEVLQVSLEALRACFQGPDSIIKAAELPMEAESSMEVAVSPKFSPRSTGANKRYSLTCEVLKLKNELTHMSASKTISDKRCIGYKRELQELKEQLDMFRSASQLGDFVIKPNAGATSQEFMDDHRQEGKQGPSQEYIIASLKSQLDTCRDSNIRKSAEIMEMVHQITALTSQLTSRQHLLDKFTAVATEIENAKLRAENESMVNIQRAIHTLEQQNNNFKKSLDNAVRIKIRQEQVIASLNAHISSLYEKYELEKRAAIEISTKAIAERLTDTALRLKHTEQHLVNTVDKEKQHPDNPEATDFKFLYAKMCIENSIRETQMKEKIVALLENILIKVMSMQQDHMDIATNEYKNLLREKGAVQESETIRMCRQMIFDAKLACLSVQKNYVRSLMGYVECDVNQLFQHQEGRPSVNIDALQCAAEMQMSKSLPPNDMTDIE